MGKITYYPRGFIFLILKFWYWKCCLCPPHPKSQCLLVEKVSKSQIPMFFGWKSVKIPNPNFFGWKSVKICWKRNHCYQWRKEGENWGHKSHYIYFLTLKNLVIEAIGRTNFTIDLVVIVKSKLKAQKLNMWKLPKVSQTHNSKTQIKMTKMRT